MPLSRYPRAEPGSRIPKIGAPKAVDLADDRADLPLKRRQRFGRQAGFHMLKVIPGNLLHEEIIRVAQIVGVIVKVDLRHRNSRVLSHEAHSGHLGHHDLLLILHHLRIWWRRDLEDNLAAIGQPDVIRRVKPAVL